MILFLTFASPGRLYADGGVRVKGRVFYYNLEEVGRIGEGNNSFSDLPGGRYLPVRNAYIEVEFDTLRVADVKTKTDKDGYFDEFVNKNPLWGTWGVNIEVSAWAVPDRNKGDPVNIKIWEDTSDLFTYNCQTGKRNIKKNSTLVFDVYIGGPQNNIEDWWDADISSLWDGGAGDGKNHISSFFLTDVITDGFNWLTQRSVEPDEIKRTTAVMFPSNDDSDKYKSFPWGNIHINSSWRLWPQDAPSREWLDVFEMGSGWNTLRGTLLHEYGHKIMHDLYWMLPARLDFWNREEEHFISGCVDPELGWKEGWAEFFSAAVQNHPTVNGAKKQEGNNIEFSYHPTALADLYHIDPPELGNLRWHYDVINNEDFDLIRDYNEGQNAAVLWDIYDEKGWEYFPENVQNSRPLEWDRPLMWYDRLEDNDLSKIWSILKDHVPDCLMDEEDEHHPFKIEDSFWYYWLEKYKNNDEYIHALKAILFNRGIISQKRPQGSPSIVTKSFDPAKRKLDLEIKELNPEDRQFLYYNIAYRAEGIDDIVYMFEHDMPLSSLGGSWNEERFETSITLPPESSWNELWLMVHDSMTPMFEKYVNNIMIDEPGEIEDKGDLIIMGSISCRDLKKPSHFTDLEVLDNYLHVVSSIDDGYYVFDVEDPSNPILVASLENLGNCTRIEIQDNYAYITNLSGNLYIFNIIDPENPREICCLNIPDSMEDILGYRAGAAPLDIKIKDDYLYVVCYNSFYIIDVSDPQNPAAVSYSEMGVGGSILDVGDNHAFVIDNRCKLRVIDVSDKTNPFSVCEFVIEGQICTHFRLSDDKKYAFISAQENGLITLDVSDPLNPAIISTFDTPGYVMHSESKDNLLYISDWDAVRIINNSSPKNPVEFKSCECANFYDNKYAHGSDPPQV